MSFALRQLFRREQRTNPRTVMNALLTVGPSPENQQEATLLDLSAGGLAFHCHARYPCGAVLYIHFPLGDNAAWSLALEGVVKHSSLDRTGVAFRNMTQEEQNTLLLGYLRVSERTRGQATEWTCARCPAFFCYQRHGSDEAIALAFQEHWRRKHDGIPAEEFGPNKSSPTS
jgi:PilZ domain